MSDLSSLPRPSTPSTSFNSLTPRTLAYVPLAFSRLGMGGWPPSLASSPFPSLAEHQSPLSVSIAPSSLSQPSPAAYGWAALPPPPYLPSDYAPRLPLIRPEAHSFQEPLSRTSAIVGSTTAPPSSASSVDTPHPSRSPLLESRNLNNMPPQLHTSTMVSLGILPDLNSNAAPSRFHVDDPQLMPMTFDQVLSCGCLAFFSISFV